MIQDRHIPKHYTNDKKEDIEIIEWELNKMFKFQSWIDCGNSKLRELSNTNPTTSAPVEEGVNLTYREIATFYYLNGIELTYDNADAIALNHGQTSRTRGQQLIEKYYAKILEETEDLSNNKYNKQIYTNLKSFETLTKIIPLLDTDEAKKIANEYLKKSESYRKVRRQKN